VTADFAQPTIRAAGGVLYRPAGAAADGGDQPADAPRQVEIALVHRQRYDDWSLPKGKPRRDETALLTARREIAEETGEAPAMQARLGAVTYETPQGRKLVEYLAARAEPRPQGGGAGGAPAASIEDPDEVDEVRWLSARGALELLSYDTDREVLDRFLDLPPITATIALVRHAHAGDRRRWAGPDDARPLTKRGLRQAQELRELLGAFGPSAVWAAAPVRCQQTVQPLADALAAPVQLADWAGEDQFARDPAGSLAELRALSRGAGAVAVCSQGGAIPALLSMLAGPTADYETAKAAFWLLSFHDGELIALDRYPAPR
jgi:8-oxo-dGTP diphosphatase